MAAATTPTSTGVVNRPTAPKEAHHDGDNRDGEQRAGQQTLQSGPVRCALGTLAAGQEDRDHTL